MEKRTDYRWGRSLKWNLARAEFRRHLVPMADYLSTHVQVNEIWQYESVRFITQKYEKRMRKGRAASR